MSRKLKLQVQISVDGFIAGTNSEMDWITWNWSEDIKKYVSELTNSFDTILLGRKLAEGFIPYWKNVAEDKNHEEHKSGIIFTNTPKIVFTKTLEKSEWENSVLAKGDLKEEINKLKNQEGKDIIVYGGANFVSNLIKENLIDELHLFVNPAVIGKGLSIFHKLENKKELKLVHSQAFECEINLLHYSLK